MPGGQRCCATAPTSWVFAHAFSRRWMRFWAASSCGRGTGGGWASKGRPRVRGGGEGVGAAAAGRPRLGDVQLCWVGKRGACVNDHVGWSLEVRAEADEPAPGRRMAGWSGRKEGIGWTAQSMGEWVVAIRSRAATKDARDEGAGRAYQCTVERLAVGVQGTTDDDPLPALARQALARGETGRTCETNALEAAASFSAASSWWERMEAWAARWRCSCWEKASADSSCKGGRWTKGRQRGGGVRAGQAVAQWGQEQPRARMHISSARSAHWRARHTPPACTHLGLQLDNTLLQVVPGVGGSSQLLVEVGHLPNKQQGCTAGVLSGAMYCLLMRGCHEGDRKRRRRCRMPAAAAAPHCHHQCSPAAALLPLLPAAPPHSPQPAQRASALLSPAAAAPLRRPPAAPAVPPAPLPAGSSTWTAPPAGATWTGAKARETVEAEQNGGKWRGAYKL